MVQRVSATKILGSFAVLMALGLAATLPSLVQAQNKLAGPSGSAENLDGVILPFDRNLSRGMQHARQRIAKSEYSQAIRFLDEVLSDEQDTFLELGETGEYAGLKAVARRMLHDLSLEGRQAYETTFAPVARRKLKAAILTGDLEQVRRIASQYSCTHSGYEAAFLLAQDHADRGQHLAAALFYQQLLDSPEAAVRFEPQLSVQAAISWFAADNASRAQSIIENLRKKPYRTVFISGEERPIHTTGQQPLDWLKQVVGEPKVLGVAHQNQWLTYGGNAARNGQPDGGLPHMQLQWRSRLLSHSKLESLYQEISHDLTRQARAVPVAAVPLAVGNYVITRSPHSLVAIDFKTGKLVWRAEPQRVIEFDRLIETSDAEPDLADATLSQAFSRRIWNDFLYSSMSSDGQRVYAIRDLSSPGSNRNAALRMPFINGRQVHTIRSATNRLCAFELATQGKLVWEIDGATSEGPLKNTFFLGAPLTIGQSLYCLAETKEGEIFLAVLDRQTGKLQWRQQLAELESAILGGASRKLQASTPSYEAGILVCPTGAGAVVGIDLARNALAWAYRYPTNLDPIRAFRMREATQSPPVGKWIDSTITIAEGRVLLTPPESASLHCLDLNTGKLLWKKPRQQRLFVAGVFQNRVVLVGNDGISALRLDSGNWAWQTAKISLPQGSVPSGRGFISKGKYFLPLSSAEVIAVDLEIGAIVDRTTSRNGQVLGNLICHRGAVISQNGQYLVRYDQVDVLRRKSEARLEQTPNDFEALRTLGEIAFNENQLPKAIELLEKAHHSSPQDLRTREVLSEALVVALDEDFASYRNRLPLLQELQGSAEGGLSTLLRLQASGLLEIHDPVGAFKVCLQLYSATEELSNNQTVQIGRHHQVEIPRWIRAQVAAIWKKADQNQKVEIAALLAELTNKFSDDSDNFQRKQFYETFGSLEALSPLGMRVAKSFSIEKNSLEAQQLYLYLAESASNAELQGEATARCSLDLHHHQYSQLARTFDQQLRTTFSEVVCLDNQTGQQLYNNLQREGQISNLTWPYGKVQVSTVSPQKTGATHLANMPVTSISLERSDEVLGYCNVLLSARTGQLVARDSYGREFFSTTLTNQLGQRLHNPSYIYGVTRGNLLIVSLGSQILAFDTFNPNDSSASKPLWRHSVVGNFNDTIQQAHGQITAPMGRPGSKRKVRAQRNGKWIGILGPVTHDSCVYQNQTHLVCVDSITGKERWRRDDLPLGCDLFGDEHYVIAIPPGTNKAFLFGTVDGRSLGETTAPRWNEQLATRGRQVIRWRKQSDGRQELSSFDVVVGETLWKYDYDRTAKIDIAASRFIAVVEGSGRATIIDTKNGNAIVDQSIAPQTRINDIYLLAGTNRLTLAITKRPTRKTTLHVRGLNSPDYAVMDGLIYVFDRKTGSPVWARPAEIEEQALMLSQPVDTPIIAFVGNSTPRDVRGGRQRIRMLILEKSSGRQLLREDELPGSKSNYCAVQVSTTSSNEVNVAMAPHHVVLHFSDLPRPPEPPVMSETGTGVKKGQKGLLGIGQKILRGG